MSLLNLPFSFLPCVGQATDPKQAGVGGHQEDPLAPVMGAQRPGASAGLTSGDAGSGVGEGQCHHSVGGPGDHGPADGGVMEGGSGA